MPIQYDDTPNPAGALEETERAKVETSCLRQRLKLYQASINIVSTPSMRALSLVALAIAVVKANVIVDDNACYRNKVRDVCEPASLCELNYNIGDLSFNQSCRVKDGVNFYPQQIHLAFAGKKPGTAMTVSWATFEDVTDSSVWLGDSEDSLELVETPVSSESYYSNKEYNLFHHHAKITGLKPRTKYFYKVGSRGDEKYKGDVGSFVTARPATDESTFNVLIYGDLGDGENSVDTIANVNQLTSNDIDLVYHLGDIAYADDDFLVLKQAAGFFYEEVYNKWMNSLMPLMSRVPYMVLVGNHEAECHSPACQLSHRLPWGADEPNDALGPQWQLRGPIELDRGGSQEGERQPRQRTVDIVGMHRPLYSVLNSENDVPNEQTALIQAAFEELIIKYKVDVVVAGHKHYYERDLPVANNEAILDGVSDDYKVYDNPQAPVYILTGGAVSDYEHFGYSMLEANRTALVWRYILSSDQSVQDKFVMYKNEQPDSRY
ncbi:calcineurin-like phosphoesterase [Phytophthora infestans T30-4]|uniref:Purple acid phosphatase n=1 Tax=Phytophthora infestans (strain T30-4) TaxID=403677 RepID=D0NUN3_PHYIT|nr:calcineurin-like phosphoesterase [Phytophthora infestans T30-4]EEY65379.1 calcineurin-like phosphoesterase [Phytophthora infestans T30-4]|eukprot:XP_002897242.1 calcineurin-like phosphoesterase [Phytophthora infestans T30-4]